MHSKKLVFLYDEEYSINLEPGYSRFIDYAKDNLIDLMKGDKNNPKSSFSEIYYTRIEKNEKIRKFPFYIYCLLADLNHFWNRNNIFDAINGRAKFEDGWQTKIERLIDKLSENSALSDYFSNKDLSYNDFIKIRYHYQKERNAIIERKMLKFLERNRVPLSPAITSISQRLTENLYIPSLSQILIKDLVGGKSISQVIAEYLDLKDDLYNYIKSQGVVILGDMRKNIRRFRKINSSFLERLLYELEEDGKISHKLHSGRTFLIAK
jgi:hypothetical protein